VVAVDNFRLLNDTYGFDVADQVLAVVAKRVKTQLRGGDAIGRIGGNKLGCILNDCDDSALAFAAARFLSCVRDEVVTTDRGVIVASVSIGGVALPRHAQTVGEATSRAEESLAAARAHGYGRFVAFVHTPGRDEARTANSSLSTSLIQALREQRMRLAFQPIVDIATRRPVFHEALLRLDGPDGSTIAAASFMPLSERLGLSRLLDQRALDLAVAALRESPTARLSVNVTPDTAADPAWLSRLSGALRHNPTIATRLTVEITETTAIRDLEDAARFVAAVKGLGCQVALDDFGAGYTSFRTLRQLEIDLVKIDGDYVKNLPTSPDDQVFVRTLAELARTFELKTVAEWVRNEETVTLLSSYGIDYIQGELSGDAVATLPPETSPAGNAG
jgi:diguanylate cyclase (GGDEF)-like protein